MNKKTILITVAIILILGGAYAGSLTRSFSQNIVEQGQSITVSLTLVIDESVEKYLAIEETVPSGWVISDPGTGDIDPQGILKWVDIENVPDGHPGPADTTYNYTVTTPNSTGTHVFSGIFQIQDMGAPANIAGQTSVTVIVPGGCLDASQCEAGEACCGGTCRAPTCVAGSECCSADGCDYEDIGCVQDLYDCTSDACSFGSCIHQLLPNMCLITNTCYDDDDSNPLNICQVCQSALNSNSWSPAPGGTVCGTTDCPPNYCIRNSSYVYSPSTCDQTCSDTSCGSCTCPPPTAIDCGTSSYCVSGSGTCSTCGENFANCDGDPLSIPACEIHLLTNNNHCGSCDNDCVANYGMNFICDDGTCVYENPCNLVDCGQRTTCTDVSGEAVCSCESGYGDCDADWGNGCEIDLSSNNSNCGSCGSQCQAWQECQSGSCTTSNPCINDVTGQPLDDLTSCGTGQYCCAGSCSTAPASCPDCQTTNYTCSGSSLVCGNEAYGESCIDDGLPCTNDICGQGASAGTCTHPLRAEGSTCGVQNSCNSEDLLCTLLACSATGECNVPSNCNTCGAVECPEGASGSCLRTCRVDACEDCAPSCIETACDDDQDNDNDGFIDDDDPDCSECFGQEDGTGCISDGLDCTDDVCESNSCAHNLQENTCLIGGICFDQGDLNPDNDCQECISGLAWDDAADESSCDDGDVCTVSDSCSAGSCVSGGQMDCGSDAGCVDSGGTPICVCDEGFFDCDEDTTNGCEVTDPVDCPCPEGDERECQTGRGCSGTQTCTSSEWGSCDALPSGFCTPEDTQDCVPVFEEIACAALTGTETCDPCGAGYGICIPDAGEVCCPDSAKDCTTAAGCSGSHTCDATGQWPECQIGDTVCSPDAVEACTPIVGGIECAALSGSSVCDSCGTGVGECFGPASAVCCPSQVQGCSVGECPGTQTCNAAGTWATCAKNDATCGTGGGGNGGGGGGGGGGAKLTVHIIGACVNQPVSVEVLNTLGNPAVNAAVRVSKDRVTVEIKTTNTGGKVEFILEETGEYTFYTTKPMYYANIQEINVINCVPPQISFEPELETGEIQTIMIIGSDGNAIRDFNVLITYPDSTTALLFAQDGVVQLPVEFLGAYTATIIAPGLERTVNFEGINPGQIVPPINPNARQTVSALFGAETVESPNFLIIWILSIAVISGLIIEVTKLKPGWFRVFMAISYTTLPLVVNFYTGNIWISFVTIAIQTTILTTLWFKIWKMRMVVDKIKALQGKSASKSKPASKNP